MRFNRLFLLLLLIASNVLYAQTLADFETATSTPVLSSQAGGQAAVVANPDTNGNDSEKVAYYKKASGNWRAIILDFSTMKNTGINDQLMFKIRSSTQGRVFVKIIDDATTILENWAPDYSTQPAANQWTLCKLDISSIKNRSFNRIEVNASVDNESAADVYLDDFRLINSLSPNGEPIVDVILSAHEITEGESIFFDASASVDLDGSIESFTWNFGDGEADDGSQVEHIFAEDGIFEVRLLVIDNEGNSAEKKISVNVFPSSGKIGALKITSSLVYQYEKAEAIFLITGNYSNVYDPDVVRVDAIITLPNQQELTVPCFYFQPATYRFDQWTRTEEEGHWMLRFSSMLAGVHHVKIKITDAEGTVFSESYPVLIEAGDARGYVRMDPTNRQYYRHTTGEPFSPLGINAAWNSTTNYAAIFENLSEGGANLVRYWQVPFDRQGLEWENGNGFYKGLGVYAQQAAAEQDSIFGLCEEYGMYLQPVLFQHGMFSENVNPNWSDNPYNIANGGMLTRAEQYFYNTEAKNYTKKLLRYIVARWGYSRYLFAWELFNEVNFTGIHPNQSSAWYPGVLAWHDEMGQYIKSLDAFNHLVSTSSDESHLEDMDELQGLDNVQYHLYNTNLLQVQTTKDKNLRSKLTRTGLINGEYGLDVTTADVPFDDQRIAIWTGVFTQVPHLMWKWENYINTNWADLFKMPSQYLQDKDFAGEGSLTDWNFSAQISNQGLGAVGFQSDEHFYGFVYDKLHRNNSSTATADLSSLTPGNYTFTYTNILTGDQHEETFDLFSENSFMLPVFSKGIAFRAKLNYSIVLGIEDLGADNGLMFHPNPSADITYTSIEQKELVEIIIYNSVGAEQGRFQVNKEKTQNEKITIDFRTFNLPPGMYLIRLQTATTSYMGKVLYHGSSLN